MRLEGDNIVETTERRVSVESIESKIANVRLRREKLRKKLEGFKKHDAELKAYEDQLRSKLQTVSVDPLVDDLPCVEFDVPTVPNPVSGCVDRKGNICLKTTKQARKNFLAQSDA